VDLLTTANPHATRAAQPFAGVITGLGQVEECVRYYPPNLDEVPDPARVFAPGPAGERGWVDLFVEVPFCSTICGFCPFNVYPHDDDRAAVYLDGLAAEIAAVSRSLDTATLPVRTVWLGGGTPTVLHETHLARLLGLVRDTFDLRRAVEFTVEVKPSPAQLSSAKVRLLRDVGVTRVSMGVQSRGEDYLRLLGRGHSWDDAVTVMDACAAAGLRQNIDMMYRLPGQSVDGVRADLAGMGALPVDHLSWFPYVPHAGTSLATRLSRGRVPRTADRDDYLRMALLIAESLSDQGFADQYTPYHFARTEDTRCEYHVGRWRMRQRETLGLGPGAFSFFNGWIYTNIHDPAAYAATAASGVPPILRGRRLTARERATRLAVLGVKFLSLDFAEFGRHVGTPLDVYYADEVALLASGGLVEVTGTGLVCTATGVAFNNAVATVFATDAARRVRHPQALDFMETRR